MNVLQTRDAKTHFESIRHVTRFTKSEFVGSQQSTDVCLTTPVWQSLMMTFAITFPVICCSQTDTKRGLELWGHGGHGQV